MVCTILPYPNINYEYYYFLLLTLIIATITLMERKRNFLSLVQRRVGPLYWIQGRLRLFADALKLLVKYCIINKS